MEGDTKERTGYRWMDPGSKRVGKSRVAGEGATPSPSHGEKFRFSSPPPFLFNYTHEKNLPFSKWVSKLLINNYG